MRKAQPFLDDDEEVVHWVRARHPDEGYRGIFFITTKRALVTWSGRKEDHGNLLWTEMKTWGLNQERREGPVVCVESVEGEAHFVQLVVATDAMARTAAHFVREFAEMAPWPEKGPVGNGSERFEPKATPELRRNPRTTSEFLRRWGVTMVGAALIVVGILIIPLPGPWSFILNIAGLAVLAREHDWADDLLDWTRDRFDAAKRKVRERKQRKRSSSSEA
jgi:uncharacterized protein (TIGR02611 family)